VLFYTIQGITIDIYTKENDTKLYIFLFGQQEYELIPTAEHKFSIKDLEGYEIEFKHLENGVFKELIAVSALKIAS